VRDWGRGGTRPYLVRPQWQIEDGARPVHSHQQPPVRAKHRVVQPFGRLEQCDRRAGMPRTGRRGVGPLLHACPAGGEQGVSIQKHGGGQTRQRLSPKRLAGRGFPQDAVVSGKPREPAAVWAEFEDPAVLVFRNAGVQQPRFGGLVESQPAQPARSHHHEPLAVGAETQRPQSTRGQQRRSEVGIPKEQRAVISAADQQVAAWMIVR
jgi:hypothetical protein